MSYGFEIKNAAGDVVLDNTDTTARVIHIEYVPYSTTSSRQFTVSNFDSNNGFYYVRPHVTPGKHDRNANVIEYYDSVDDVDYGFPAYTDISGLQYYEYSGGQTELVATWDNSSKIMTVSPSETLYPVFTSTSFADLGNMEIVFMEYA